MPHYHITGRHQSLPAPTRPTARGRRPAGNQMTCKVAQNTLLSSQTTTTPARKTRRNPPAGRPARQQGRNIHEPSQQRKPTPNQHPKNPTNKPPPTACRKPPKTPTKHHPKPPTHPKTTQNTQHRRVTPPKPSKNSVIHYPDPPPSGEIVHRGKGA